MCDQVLKWSKKKGAEGSPRPKTKDERETERRRELEKELSQYKAENERLRLMLKRTTQTARVLLFYLNGTVTHQRLSHSIGLGRVLQQRGRHGADQIGQDGYDVPPFSGTTPFLRDHEQTEHVSPLLTMQVGDLEKQLNLERQEHQEAAKRAATAEAENELLKKRIADLDGAFQLISLFQAAHCNNSIPNSASVVSGCGER